ncbi:MAG: hypothetical protein G8345_17180 [Magnetococcales bacterium]|nr:hypothetical protein [Magnetococcales bacterium]NGZ28611.1 hypothetical protein [Magnetococcales bacterium]
MSGYPKALLWQIPVAIFGSLMVVSLGVTLYKMANCECPAREGYRQLLGEEWNQLTRRERMKEIFPKGMEKEKVKQQIIRLAGGERSDTCREEKPASFTCNFPLNRDWAGYFGDVITFHFDGENKLSGIEPRLMRIKYTP